MRKARDTSNQDSTRVGRASNTYMMGCHQTHEQHARGAFLADFASAHSAVSGEALVSAATDMGVRAKQAVKKNFPPACEKNVKLIKKQ